MYIGIDLGGTNIAAGVVDESGKIIYKSSVPTLAQRPIEEIVEDMADLCVDIVDGANCSIADIKAVGIGCPGTVDNKSGVIAYSCNLKMKNTELRAMLEKRLGKRINLENDANAAALGEYAVNGDNADSFVLITLGTGVGGGIIVDGKIIDGSRGYGGEIGHMTVDPFDDRVCNCGKTGCLELYASATGIVYETKKALKDFKEATTLRDLDEVTAKDIFDAAKEGDTFAKERVDDLGQKLALAAGNIALMVDPEVFVIGGGVSRAGQILLDAVNAHFKKYTFGKAQETGFVLATLGNDAGIYGAASLMLS